jgi:hypothetical protein
MNRIVRHYFAQKPDVTIGSPDDPHLLRWYVIPRNRFFNIYLHLFLRSDNDRALHDHPWLFNLSILLEGEYDEIVTSGRARRHAGQWKLRIGPAPHRLELVDKQFCWTLFVTGPRYRTWGFYCPQGWIPWMEFTKADNPGEIGPGCGE